MNIVEASVAALDKQLEEKIAEMEANNESPETIKAVIEEYESKKRELGLASRAEHQEMSFEQRKAAEDAEAERLESMRFVNHGHVTKEDIDEANKDSWWGHQDEHILPMLQEIYGEDYDIENDHSFRASVKFTNKITCVS